MKEAMEDRRDMDTDEERRWRRGWRSGHHVLTIGFQGQRAIHTYNRGRELIRFGDDEMIREDLIIGDPATTR